MRDARLAAESAAIILSVIIGFPRISLWDGNAEDMFVTFLEGIAFFQDLLHGIHILAGDGRAEPLCPLEHTDKGIRLVPACKLAERTEVILPENGRYNDLRLACGGQFGVHHDPCEPAVSVQKRVHLADHEHHVCSFGKGIVQGAIKIEAPDERTPDERMVDELGIARTVISVLKFAGVLGGAGDHQRPVTIAQYFQQLPGIFGCDGHFLPVGHDLVCTEHVVGVLVPRGQGLSGLDDPV